MAAARSSRLEEGSPGNLRELAGWMQTLAIPREAASGRPPRDDVRAIERRVATLLASTDLLVECLHEDLAMRASRATESASLRPFHTIEGLGVRLALAYWAPGRAAGAHEHASWTVTAVVHNRLEVETYDWERAVVDRRLVRKRVFDAERGRVGHIYDPCIHNPRNPTDAWSISLHLFAPPAPSQLGEDAPIDGLTGVTGAADASPPDPPTALDAWMYARNQQDRYRAAIAAVEGARTPGAVRLLRALHAAGDHETRARSAATLARIDPERGAPLLARAAEERLTSRTRLRKAHVGAPLAVHTFDGKAELVIAGSPDLVLLRVSTWAERALRFVAETDTFDVASIPGDLAVEDAITLAGALVARGVFSIDLPLRDTAGQTSFGWMGEQP